MGGRGSASGRKGGESRNAPPATSQTLPMDNEDTKQKNIEEQDIESLESDERQRGSSLRYAWKSEPGAEIEVEVSYHERVQKNVEAFDDETTVKYTDTDKVSVNGVNLRKPEVTYDPRIGDYVARGVIPSGENKGREIATVLPPDIKEKLFGADIRKEKRQARGDEETAKKSAEYKKELKALESPDDVD